MIPSIHDAVFAFCRHVVPARTLQISIADRDSVRAAGGGAATLAGAPAGICKHATAVGCAIAAISGGLGRELQWRAERPPGSARRHRFPRPGDIAVRPGWAVMTLETARKPDATAETFRVDRPVTGDRGLLEDGFLRFVGRANDVIAPAGYRIAPAEIKDCLLAHSGIATVRVVGKPDDLRTEIVKAYVVPRLGAALTAGALRASVEENLSTHCHSGEITVLDALPTMVTGKVVRRDRKARATREGPA